MKIHEQRISIAAPASDSSRLDELRHLIDEHISSDKQVVRLAVTNSTSTQWEVEIGTVQLQNEADKDSWRSTLQFRERGPENQSQFNVVLIVPTGIGAELGGHCGDAGPVARMFGEFADHVITHPNVVNASDINELPANGLYVEGSILTRLLMGDVGLRKVRSNRVLTIVDNHREKELVDHAINSVGAARASMGVDCPLAVRLPGPLDMRSIYSESGRAVGEVGGIENLLEVTECYAGSYDAIAITSRIQVPKSYHHEYYLGGLVNPWGGVEAMLTHTVSTLTGYPSAHSPMMESEDILNLNLGVVDPRMAAEVVSVTYLNCVLKGLQRSPQVVWDRSLVRSQGTLWAEDVSAVVVPKGCLGLPVLAALEQQIPVIEVLGNTNLMCNALEELGFPERNLVQVESYLEAAGVVAALRSGVSVASLKRPLERTRVEPKLHEEAASELGDVIRYITK